MMNKQMIADLKKADPAAYDEIKTFLLLGEAAKSEIRYRVPNEPEPAVPHTLSVVGAEKICDTIRTPDGTRFLVVTPGTTKVDELNCFELGDEVYEQKQFSSSTFVVPGV